MDDTRKENNKEGSLIHMAITEEEKKRRKQDYEKNRNISMSDYDADYIDYWLANRPNEIDLIYESWINGEIELDEVSKLMDEYIKRL
jgi:hypothetical protein